MLEADFKKEKYLLVREFWNRLKTLQTMYNMAKIFISVPSLYTIRIIVCI